MENTYFTASIIYFVATIVLTGVLLFITFKYARHTKVLAEDTKKMADIIERDYIAKNTAVVDFSVYSASSSDNVEVTLQIWNHTAIPSTLTEIAFLGLYKDTPSKVCEVVRRVNVLLSPGIREHKISIHRHELIPSDDSKYQSLSTYQLAHNVEGKFRISYSDNRGGMIHKEREYHF